MSATPIPRSLALALHGDLDASFLTERPAGRAPAAAVVCVGAAERRAAYERAARGDRRGAPGVRRLPGARGRPAARTPSPRSRSTRGCCAQLAPGARRPAARGADRRRRRRRRCARSRRGALDVLVATTVVELGIDVPNATVMIVEEADRFGVAQLHQLRGRVGRGRWPGICFLCAGDAGCPTRRARRLALVAANRRRLRAGRGRPRPARRRRPVRDAPGGRTPSDARPPRRAGGAARDRARRGGARAGGAIRRWPRRSTRCCARAAAARARETLFAGDAG